MNLLGLHAMVLTYGDDAAAFDHAADIAAHAGYDLLELPILEPRKLDVDAARTAAAVHGLQLATSLGLSEPTDVSSEDTAIVRAGIELLHAAVDVTAAVGASWMCGVLASALRKYSGPPSESGRANAVAALREIADHASDADINLGIELVNRYESNLITNVTDGLRFIDDVGSDRLHIHLDTYHALIEEDSLSAAVFQARDRLGYVHVGQNDRGSLTAGTVDIDAFLAALDAVGFSGPITFEAFSRAASDPDLSDRLAIWRSPWTDGAVLAAEASAFLRARLPSAPRP